jgi:biotin carboxyl carrier protein
MNSTPQRRLKVMVNGHAYLVEVDDLFTSPIKVTVNGQPYQVEISTPAVEQVSADGPAAALEQVARQPLGPAESFRLGGPVEITDREVRAPMPGHIADIAVRVGDKVSTGQVLCSLEAMKMKNSIRSPREGVVASVEVTVGQPVGHGDVLLTFESEANGT